LGTKFNPERFHDFILSEGLLPPDLLRKAVTKEFMPANSDSQAVANGRNTAAIN